MQDSGGGSTIGSLIAGIIWLALVVFLVIALWKVYAKAGQPGWACLVPIYNLYVLCKIAGKPGWWVILMFIPIVNFVIALLVALAVAQQFGKGTGFGVGLFFVPIVFYPILAFGDATYGGAVAPSAPPAI